MCRLLVVPVIADMAYAQIGKGQLEPERDYGYDGFTLYGIANPSSQSDRKRAKDQFQETKKQNQKELLKKVDSHACG